MSDEQDMRNMGGIWRKIPITYAMMWIGSLALAGMPFFAGYFSKDLVLEVAWASHGPFAGYAFWLGIAAAVMTAFYSWRLLFMTFHGQPRASEEVMSHVHESPYVMTIPLGLLAVGAILAGFLGLPMVAEDMAFWGGSIAMVQEPNIIEEAHHVSVLIKILPILAGLIGIGLAYVFYIMNPGLPRRLAEQAQGLYRFLLNKWYVDELYEFLFVRPAKRAGHALWQGGDIGIIDTFGPNGVAATALSVARRATMLQTGYVYHYAFAMLIGIAALVTWYLFRL
jgi:NADH-quinone oxidoreductase subunit L